jgi:peptide/nickel transport system permease protein
MTSAQYIYWLVGLPIVLGLLALFTWNLWRAGDDSKDRRGPLAMLAIGGVLVVYGTIAAAVPAMKNAMQFAQWMQGVLLFCIFVTLLRPAFVIKRALWMIPTLFIISLVSFIIIQLPPGDFLTSQIAALEQQGETVSIEQAESMRKMYDLDRPMPEQYLRWLCGLGYADAAPPKPGEVEKWRKSATGFSARAVASDRIALAWPANPDAKSYVVERGDGAGGWTRLGDPKKPLDKTAFEDHRGPGEFVLQTAKAYTYRLQAVDAAGTPLAQAPITVEAKTLGKKWQILEKGGLLQGNLGQSFEWNKPVKEVIGDRIMLTMVISIFTLLLTWIIAVPIGIYSAVKQYSFGDYAATFMGFIGLAVPNFLLALICMYVSYAVFHKSVGGLFSAEYQNQPWSWMKIVDLSLHMWVPVIVIGVANTAGMIRSMRGNLLDELRKQYVLTAQAKGLKRITLLLKYPVRVALNPFVSTIGYVLPGIISGETLTSVVLGLPTVGPLQLRALMNQDMFLAGSMVMILAMLTVVGTLLSDLLLLWLDPRIQFEGGKAD